MLNCKRFSATDAGSSVSCAGYPLSFFFFSHSLSFFHATILLFPIPRIHSSLLFSSLCMTSPSSSLVCRVASPTYLIELLLFPLHQHASQKILEKSSERFCATFTVAGAASAKRLRSSNRTALRRVRQVKADDGSQPMKAEVLVQLCPRKARF